MHAKYSRLRLNWIAVSLLTTTVLTSGGCAKLYHFLHYNCLSRTISEHHHRSYYHSGKTGRIIADEHRANCAVEPPCFGYEATCWHRWPEGCGECPQEQVILDVPYGQAHPIANEFVPAPPAAPTDPNADPEPPQEVDEYSSPPSNEPRNDAASGILHRTPVAADVQDIAPLKNKQDPTTNFADSQRVRSVDELGLQVDDKPDVNERMDQSLAAKTSTRRVVPAADPKVVADEEVVADELQSDANVKTDQVASADVVDESATSPAFVESEATETEHDLTADILASEAPVMEDTSKLAVVATLPKTLMGGSPTQRNDKATASGPPPESVLASTLALSEEPEIPSFKINAILPPTRPTIAVAPARIVERDDPVTTIRFASKKPIVKAPVVNRDDISLRFR